MKLRYVFSAPNMIRIHPSKKVTEVPEEYKIFSR